jgi:hypothetical protein
MKQEPKKEKKTKKHTKNQGKKNWFFEKVNKMMINPSKFD